jgi:16S rRNA (adenine1518-N6/adenine1519-N6)-dimethyltransferase
MSQPIIAKKSLGQHWLNDSASLQKICETANLSSSDIVLEIGPGLGSLTELLISRAKKLYAVELDEALGDKLSTKFTTPNFELIRGDILAFDLTKLPAGYKVVANIPYYLSSKLLRVLSESTNPPSLIVLLVQKELAERVGAEPGDMSLLSVSTQFYWQVELRDIITADKFNPKPKVDSQVILMTRRSSFPFDLAEQRKFFQLVKAGFAARRKTLENSLAGGLRVDKGSLIEVLNQAQLDPKLRPQTLSIEEWLRLYKSAKLSNLF